MALQRIRNAAAALALAGILCAATPANAAHRAGLIAFPGWIESALEWISRVWVGSEARKPKPVVEKLGCGIDANDCPSSPASDSDLGHGIDPNG